MTVEPRVLLRGSSVLKRSDFSIHRGDLHTEFRATFLIPMKKARRNSGGLSTSPSKLSGLLDDLNDLAGLRLHDDTLLVHNREAVIGVIGNRMQHNSGGKRLADHDLFLDAHRRDLLAGHICADFSRRFSRSTNRGAHGAANN